MFGLELPNKSKILIDFHMVRMIQYGLRKDPKQKYALIQENKHLQNIGSDQFLHQERMEQKL